MTCGIYSITCVRNSRKYVGQSVNLERRWKQHRSRANLGNHSNPRLQACWDKYGEPNFKFEILEVCEEKILSEREEFWIDKLGTSHTLGGLNLEEKIRSDIYRRRPSKSQIAKRVSSVSKRIKAFGEEKTVREWCEIYHQVPSTVHWRLRSGWSAEKALLTPSQKKSFIFEGVNQSLTDHCRRLNLNPKTVQCRISRGWSLEKALTVSVGD